MSAREQRDATAEAKSTVRPPSGGGTTVQLLVLGGVYIGLGVLSDTAYAFAGAWIGDRLHGIPVVARRTTLLAGTTYIGLGVATAASGSGSRS